MALQKNLNANAIELIQEAVSEIRHYTNPANKDHESWRGLANNAIEVLLSIPFITNIEMSESDQKIWKLICKPYRFFAEQKSKFTWKEISPFVDITTQFLERYGYTSIKPKVKKAAIKLTKPKMKLVEPISEDTNRAVANVYLYTLWKKDPNKLISLCPKLDPTKKVMKQLLKDGIWHLSGLGNTESFEELLDMEYISYWTEMVIALENCGIKYVDPLVWISNRKNYNPYEKKDRKAA